MLNKDQYNQDEYNNYYKQETEGAEIKGFNEDEGGFLKKAILFLGLIVLGVAGYFGFKVFNNTSDNSVTKEKLVIKEETPKTIKTEVDNDKSIEDKVIETIKNNKEKIDKVVVNTEETARKMEDRAKAVEDKIEKTIQKEVATQVQEKVEGNKKMSTEDISKIVNIVMNKMEKEKVVNKKADRDNDLLNALENSDNDTEKTAPKEHTKIIANSESVVKKEVDRVNTTNKVTVNHNSNSKDDDLTALSEQIKKLLNMAGANDKSHKKSTHIISKAETTVIAEEESSDTDTTNYEASLTPEIEVRTNEMRIIIVKPGDTLNKIAKRAYGDASSYQKIFDANPNISRADKIYVGQKLRIPE